MGQSTDHSLYNKDKKTDQHKEVKCHAVLEISTIINTIYHMSESTPTCL